MVVRVQKLRDEWFWGCSRFPLCRGTEPMSPRELAAARDHHRTLINPKKWKHGFASYQAIPKGSTLKKTFVKRIVNGQEVLVERFDYVRS